MSWVCLEYFGMNKIVLLRLNIQYRKVKNYCTLYNKTCLVRYRAVVSVWRTAEVLLIFNPVHSDGCDIVSALLHYKHLSFVQLCQCCQISQEKHATCSDKHNLKISLPKTWLNWLNMFVLSEGNCLIESGLF